MNKIQDLAIETSASGRSVPGTPEYEPARFVTTITFSTVQYPGLCDRELLQYMLEQVMETQKKLSTSQPVTDLIQVK